jgi:outer membrane protein
METKEKVDIIFKTLLFAGIILLLIIYLTSGNKNTKQTSNTNRDTSITNTLNYRIAYINVDTLLKKYKYYEILEKKLLDKQKSLENSLNSKMQEFEKEVKEFQKKIQLNSFLSEESAKRQQQELIIKEQNLYKMREDLSLQLAKETQELEKQLLDTVVNFLKEYNRDNKYDFIFNKAALLYGVEAMDITDTIVYLLNQRYEASKPVK